VAYGVLYVAIEIVGHQLEQVGWSAITPLDVATAVTDAFLVVALCGAVLVALDLLSRRWRRSMQAWHLEQARLAREIWDDEPIGVASWRPAPLALPSAEPPAPSQGTYTGNPYSFAGYRYPQEPDRRL
jgi:hypothetical protein